MPQTYRVRYSLKTSAPNRFGAPVVTVDVEGDLEVIPARLPPGAYIMYVEDLTMGRDVHWTRWPRIVPAGLYRVTIDRFASARAAWAYPSQGAETDLGRRAVRR